METQNIRKVIFKVSELLEILKIEANEKDVCIYVNVKNNSMCVVFEIDETRIYEE